MATTAFDTDRAEAFAERVLEMLNSGALIVMTSVGYRTGLFDALAGAGALTSTRVGACRASGTAASTR